VKKTAIRIDPAIKSLIPPLAAGPEKGVAGAGKVCPTPITTGRTAMSTYTFMIEVTSEHVWRVEADTPEGAAEVLARQMAYGGLPSGAGNMSWEVTGLYRDGETVVPVPEIQGGCQGQLFAGEAGRCRPPPEDLADRGRGR
jgi:hypothetical protein